MTADVGVTNDYAEILAVLGAIREQPAEVHRLSRRLPRLLEWARFSQGNRALPRHRSGE